MIFYDYFVQKFSIYILFVGLIAADFFSFHSVPAPQLVAKPGRHVAHEAQQEPASLLFVYL